MLQRVRSHLSFANLVSSVALFVALGGTALAAVIVHDNSEVASNTISGHNPPAGKHANIILGSVNDQDVQNLKFQALTLKNRDFILAAKASGEPTWRIVFGELMPNMISRIAAAFVLVFYIALLVDSGLEFLG